MQAEVVLTVKKTKGGPGGWLLLLTAMLLVAGGQIALHWGLSRGMFPNLIAAYLYRNPQTHKSSGAYLLMTIGPGVVLGALNGWLGYGRWTPRTLLVNAFGISLMVDALIPFYGRFIGEEFRGSPFAASVASFLITWFLTMFVYVQRLEWEKRRIQQDGPGVPPS